MEIVKEDGEEAKIKVQACAGRLLNWPYGDVIEVDDV
jgi:hypothetical protein